MDEGEKLKEKLKKIKADAEMPPDVFLLFGALGAGKTASCSFLRSYFGYKIIEMDKYLSDKFNTPVTEYFAKEGVVKFYNETLIAIEEIKEQESKAMQSMYKSVMIDIGSGSLFDYRAVELAKQNNSVLLTADPSLLYQRNKCKEVYNEFGSYNYWQFMCKRDVYEACKIKIDVGYLNLEQVAETVYRKIEVYKKEVIYK